MEPRSARPPLYSEMGRGMAAPYFAQGSSSFSDFIADAEPHLLPGRMPQSMHPAGQPLSQAGRAGVAGMEVPHGTTIVALTFEGGVLIAGDRRATAGNLIAQRDIEKVFVTDNYSAVGIAGAAGMAVEMVRLFTVDLEHYEKIEGVPLSLDGKANKVAGMVRANLGAALQGFAVVPLFIGFDVDAVDAARAGRIVTFDVTGGRYDEASGYHSVGSGSLFAKTVLKKTHDPHAERDVAVRTAIEALYDAAEDDSATGGPDLTRNIFPVVVTITGAEGSVRRPDEEIGEIVRAVVLDRMSRPGG